MADWDPHGIQRRVAGSHDLRLDGVTDILTRARGATVLDLGCNRGMVGYEFYCNGARIVHGCDIDAESIQTARNVFADLRSVRSQFEVIDLTEGAAAIDKALGAAQYDIVVLLATYHKIKRDMPGDVLSELMIALGRKARKYFVWRGRSSKHITKEDHQDYEALSHNLMTAGLQQVHYSTLSEELGPAAIWARR